MTHNHVEFTVDLSANSSGEPFVLKAGEIILLRRKAGEGEICALPRITTFVILKSMGLHVQPLHFFLHPFLPGASTSYQCETLKGSVFGSVLGNGIERLGSMQLLKARTRVVRKQPGGDTVRNRC